MKMPDPTECLQFIYGPTPCFRTAGLKICELSECEVAQFLNENPWLSRWYALHHHCPVTDPFDYRGTNRPIQIRLIAEEK